jgi:hypothetical protein
MSGNSGREPRRIRLVAVPRLSALTILALAWLAGAVRADEWDDLAQKLVDRTNAQVVRRAGAIIVFSHPLISDGIMLDATDDAPGLSYQFRTTTRPSEAAFGFMAEASALLTGDLATVIGNALERCYDQAAAGSAGVADIAGEGYFVDCVLIPSVQLSFYVSRD